MKKFMVDIECTDVSDFENNDILQFAFVALEQRSGGFWHPTHFLLRNLASKKTPKNDWDRKHLGLLYDVCNDLDPEPVEKVRNDILNFFAFASGDSSPVTLMGYNCLILDIPFLTAKGYLQAPGRNPATNEATGDFSYRVCEMSGAIDLAQDILGVEDRAELRQMAFDAYPEIELPSGAVEHNAFYDCMKQVREYNGLIRLVAGLGGEVRSK